MYDDKRRKLVIFGAGLYAIKFLYRFREKDKIDFFIDNYYPNKTILNWNVYTYEESKSKINKQLMLVCSAKESYCNIKHYLLSQGLEEFSDFIPAEMYIKKVALLNGNCYMQAYEEFLRNSKEFVEQYYIYEIPLIHLNEEKKINEKLLKYVDLFVHQDIRYNNQFSEFLSDEYIRKYLKPECRELIVPNLVGFGKWCFPFADFENNKELMLVNLGKNGAYMLWCYNEIVERGIREKKEIDEIVEDLQKDLISHKEIEESFFNQMEKLKEREKNWDIKVSDYILNNYKKEKLFTDCHHLTSTFLKEICKRIAMALHLSEYNLEISVKYEQQEEFVLPVVKRALKMQWDDPIIRADKNNDKRLNEGGIDINEYVKEYVFWRKLNL